MNGAEAFFYGSKINDLSRAAAVVPEIRQLAHSYLQQYEAMYAAYDALYRQLEDARRQDLAEADRLPIGHPVREETTDRLTRYREHRGPDGVHANQDLSELLAYLSPKGRHLVEHKCLADYMTQRAETASLHAKLLDALETHGIAFDESNVRNTNNFAQSIVAVTALETANHFTNNSNHATRIQIESVVPAAVSLTVAELSEAAGRALGKSTVGVTSLS